MAAVVRIKRHIEDEPLSAFVFKSKKRKLETDTKVDEETEPRSELRTEQPILRLAGTIEHQDNTAISQFLRKTAVKEIIDHKGPNLSTVRKKNRSDVQNSSINNRFRVVNCLRKTLTATEDQLPEEITIVDIEKQSVPDYNESTINQQDEHRKMSESADTACDSKYVYDIYVNADKEFNYKDYVENNLVSIRPFDDMVYEDCYDNSSDDGMDSDDSNDENYYANDYPDDDEDAEGSDEEDSLHRAVRNFVLDDDDNDEEANSWENSSDDEDYYEPEDSYIHSVDVDEAENGD